MWSLPRSPLFLVTTTTTIHIKGGGTKDEWAVILARLTTQGRCQWRTG
jgi:hypothetical protein